MALIAPGEIRVQSLAIYNSFIALVGPLFGPPLVGWMIDRTGDPKSIGVILFGYVALIGIPSILFLILGLRPYREEAFRLESSLSPAIGRASCRERVCQ